MSTPKPALPWMDREIILASKSPRRQQLLTAAGIPFRIETNEVEEDFPEDMPVEQVAAFLARKKAQAAKDFIKNREVVLAADSIVILDDQIFGKPENRDHAIEILHELSGNIHQVITGVCLLSSDKERVFSGYSKVHFAPLTLEEIEYYIDTFQPYDKAGAYAIQEWIGLCKITRIEGTYTNIMGLPMELVYQELM
ncbi:MAG: septum formation protein Maf, partial [Lewinella sp.]|nr:septum formation protein Maf [Lewinella sp.]